MTPPYRFQPWACCCLPTACVPTSCTVSRTLAHKVSMRLLFPCLLNVQQNFSYTKTPMRSKPIFDCSVFEVPLQDAQPEYCCLVNVLLREFQQQLDMCYPTQVSKFKVSAVNWMTRIADIYFLQFWNKSKMKALESGVQSGPSSWFTGSHLLYLLYHAQVVSVHEKAGMLSPSL